MASANKVSSEWVLILTSLADRMKHGYAIQQDIAHLSGRQLGPGSLYGAIARLEAAGYIAAVEPEGQRRPYRITASGLRTLADQVESMRRLAAVAQRRIALR
jgi:DNA-binding PadR family transcriptional regulator